MHIPSTVHLTEKYRVLHFMGTDQLLDFRWDLHYPRSAYSSCFLAFLPILGAIPPTPKLQRACLG